MPNLQPGQPTGARGLVRHAQPSLPQRSQRRAWSMSAQSRLPRWWIRVAAPKPVGPEPTMSTPTWERKLAHAAKQSPQLLPVVHHGASACVTCLGGRCRHGAVAPVATDATKGALLFAIAAASRGLVVVGREIVKLSRSPDRLRRPPPAEGVRRSRARVSHERSTQGRFD